METTEKEEIHEEVMWRVAEIADLVDPPSALCFYYGVFGIEVIRERKTRAILQAGSLSWPRLRPDQDDGVVMTHFSYMWSPESSASRQRMMEGMLPELHIWIGLPAENEIVDFTTGFLPTQARLLADLDWPGEAPPKYLWGKPPERVVYEPHAGAVLFVLKKATRLWGIKRAHDLIT